MPYPYAPGDLPTAAELNAVIARTLQLLAADAITGTPVTLLPAGSVTEWCYLLSGVASNDTTGPPSLQLGTAASAYRTPGGANINFTDGGTNVLTMIFGGDGSVTISRTAGTANLSFRGIIYWR